MRNLHSRGGGGSSLGHPLSARRFAGRPRSGDRSPRASNPSSSSTSAPASSARQPPPTIEITVATSISDVPSHEWDALVRSQPEYNPCVSHSFFRALEESGSATPGRGWMPHHLVARVTSPSPPPSSGGDEPRLVGAVPCYLKSHSQGEYVFDQGWADASHRLGKSYYPKAVAAVPMSPVPGPRLLAVDVPLLSAPSSRPDRSTPPPPPGGNAGAGAPRVAATADQVRLSLADALAELSTSDATRDACSGAHVLFCSSDSDAAALAATGRFRQRLGVQYHWFNDRGSPGAGEAARGEGERRDSDPYESFDDFLSRLRQSKRKLVRQERKRAGGPRPSESSSPAPPLSFSRVRGTDLRSDELAALHSFYVDTCERRWGNDYLTEEFFHRLGENPDVLVVLASEPPTTGIERRRDRAAEEDGLRSRRVVVAPPTSAPPRPPAPLAPPFTPFGPRGRPLAGALNLVGSHALFGRNWGCDPSVRSVPFLHFELSYYQAIEAAIDARLPRVEAGAQGEHKIARGYVPTLTRSFHALRDEVLDSAVASFLRSEAREVEYVAEAMRAQMSPYKS